MAQERIKRQLKFFVNQIHGTIQELLNQHLPNYIQLASIYEGTARELLREGLAKLATEKIIL